MEAIVSNGNQKEKGLNMESVDDLKKMVSDEDSISEDIPEKKSTMRITNKDMERYRENIKTFNYIELGGLRRELETEKEGLKSANEAAKSILKINKDFKDGKYSSELAKDIATSNEEDNMTDDIREFLSYYDDSMEKLDIISKEIEERLKEFDDIPKTTSYMSSMMLEIIAKNEKKAEEIKNQSQKKRVMQFYKNQEEIFSNRDSVDFILSKIPNNEFLVRRIVNDLLKDKKGFVLKGVQKSVTHAFGSVFSVNQLTMFEKYLTDLYEDDTDAFFVQYVLYLIYKREKEYKSYYGKFKWVEMLIMNIMDIATDNYDLESGVDAYNEKLITIRDAISPMIEKFKKKKK